MPVRAEQSHRASSRVSGRSRERRGRRFPCGSCYPQPTIFTARCSSRSMAAAAGSGLANTSRHSEQSRLLGHRPRVAQKPLQITSSSRLRCHGFARRSPRRDVLRHPRPRPHPAKSITAGRSVVQLPPGPPSPDSGGQRSRSPVLWIIRGSIAQHRACYRQ